jgi:putative spermidine/putrescine transport system permease protein
MASSVTGSPSVTPPTTSDRGATWIARWRPAPGRGWRLLAVPALLWLAAFYLYPVLRILSLSFLEFTAPQVGGLDNYTWFFTTQANVTVLARTFWISALIALVTLLLGYPYAYLMSLTSGWRRLLMLSAVIIPLTISPLVRSYAWIGLLHINGPVNGLLELFGVERRQILGSLSAVAIGMTHINFPLMVLPLFASLLRIDRRLIDAALSLGAPPRVAFLQVYLPQSLPGVIAGTVLVFVNSLGFYLTPALLGSPRQSLLSPLIITQTRLVLAWGRAGTMAMVLLVFTLALLGAAAWATRRGLQRTST